MEGLKLVAAQTDESLLDQQEGLLLVTAAELKQLIQLYRNVFADGFVSPTWREAFAKTISIRLAHSLTEQRSPNWNYDFEAQSHESTFVRRIILLMQIYRDEFCDRLRTPTWQQAFVETIRLQLLIVDGIGPSLEKSGEMSAND